MQKGEERVREEHARPGIPHHLADFFTLRRGVTMDRTFTAGGFALLKGAMEQTLPGIGEQCLAVVAQDSFAAVPVPAVTVDHRFHGSGLPLQAS
jgi:hypothetical protein